MSRADSIKHYMSSSVICLTADMDILGASRILVNKNISGAPVIDENNHVIGILSARDCFKITINAGYHAEPGGKVKEYMSQNVKCVSPDMSIFDLAELFLNSHYRRYPVVDNNRLIGIISRRDALRAILELS